MSVKHIEDEILQLTKDLIRIPSTSQRPEKIIQCADFITKWLDENFIKYSRYDINNVPSIAVLPSEKTGTKVLLMAHFDVVEVEDEALFTPRVENGRLYGRGAIDDKYAVALSLLLFRNHLALLQERGLGQEDMCFGLLLTGDEEIGGRDGAGTVGEKIETDFFLALDGGNPGLIVTKEKGILRIHLEATGKAAHAARPWLGRNAFDLLMDDYMAIKALFTEKNADHWHKTVALTRCTAGNGSVNMIPGKAEAVLDIRYPERDDPDELLAAIEKVVTGKVTLQDSAAVFFGGESPFTDRLQKHTKGAVLGFEHGSSDARYLSERNVPGALWGAAGEMSQHTEEEHIVL
ncbi:MAG: M20 family metallopeptidase, partial [Deltaproteobacteria bacterium]|nr:M20 family metallopeptidase [Deltaproteobacteria bacterium]